MVFLAIALSGCLAQPDDVPETYQKSFCGGLPKGWTTQSRFAEELAKRSGITDLGIANHLLVSKDGTIFWNSYPTPVSEKKLKSYVEIMRHMSIVPRIEVHIDAEASCTGVNRVRSVLNPICNPCIDLTATEWRQFRSHSL